MTYWGDKHLSLNSLEFYEGKNLKISKYTFNATRKSDFFWKSGRWNEANPQSGQALVDFMPFDGEKMSRCKQPAENKNLKTIDFIS